MPRFDRYSWRARRAPALLVVAPLLTVCFFEPTIGSAWAAVPLLFVAAAALFAEEITRQMGKNLELRLKATWDGLPTVRSLRFRSRENVRLRDLRRREVSRLCAATLPTEAEEQADPLGADQRYDDAVRRCLAIERRRDPNSMLSEENARYGFRRNLLSLKFIALGVLAVVLYGNYLLVAGSYDSVPFKLSAALIGVDAVVWLGVIRKPWVKAQAETLSERFFLAIGTLP